MIPDVKADQQCIQYWINDLEQDEVIGAVLKSRPFQRLHQVSFLGALDYVATTNKEKKGPRSRAVHSLHVAALANFVATHRGYDNDLKRHLVIAGLLHDVGHIPLSHSVEPYVQEKFGFGHHELSEAIMRGEVDFSKVLGETLKQSADPGFLLELVNGRATPGVGGDLFSSPINIDTIDGIIRTYGYLSRRSHDLDPFSVATASFLNDDESRYSVLDQFWHTKHFVYENLINNRLGLLADNYSRLYFSEEKVPMDESALLEQESQWRRKYATLFTGLNKIDVDSRPPDSIVDKVIFYKKRVYTVVDSDKSILGRYRSARTKATVRFSDSQAESTKEQASLF
ncbi:HD domain-containing protein [Natronospirillum operosum]|nr:HD domain-containing protein [Natronospirillum operosum]